MSSRQLLSYVLTASVCFTSAPAWAQSPQSAQCGDFTAARAHAYTPYIQTVMEDLRTASTAATRINLNEAIKALANDYERRATTGDTAALRKLIGIGLFTAVAAKQTPLEVTFKLICESARINLPPQNVLDPLACAVSALDGNRRADASNRKLASEMLQAAKVNLAYDPDPKGAQNLIDKIGPVVRGCAS